MQVQGSISHIGWRRRAVRVGLLASVCAGVFTLGVNSDGGSGEPRTDRAIAYGLVGGAKLRTVFGTWGDQARSRAATIVLRQRLAGSVLGGSVRAAAVELDLDQGTIRLAARGLERGQVFDLWALDHRDGGSMRADGQEGARRLHLAEVSGGGAERVELEQAIGVETFETFDVSELVLVEKGEDPATEGIRGVPSLFARARLSGAELSASSESIQAMSDAVNSRWRIGVREGYASSVMLRDGLTLDELVARGADLFFNETFDGNGRTCGTCHPAENSFTIDPKFIAQLPPDDPLFVAETVEGLEGLDDPLLLRMRGVTGHSPDGFDQARVTRSVPHLLALSTSIQAPNVPFDSILGGGRVPPVERIGLSSDLGAGTGSLREVTIAAVASLFTRSLERRPGMDFRMPTPDELDALEAFQLSLGRQQDLDLDRLRLTDPIADRGRVLFKTIDTTDPDTGERVRAGKCNICHLNAGASVFVPFFVAEGVSAELQFGNADFPTGVNDLPAQPDELIAGPQPRDGGFGINLHAPGACRVFVPPDRPDLEEPAPAGGRGVITVGPPPVPPGLCLEDFNTPPLVEAADTPPFFHNNAVDTIEGAVDFYDGEVFANTLSGFLLRAADSNGVDIDLEATEVEAIAKFLRAINADENLRQAMASLDGAQLTRDRGVLRSLLAQAIEELEDARNVLEPVNLNLDAVSLIDSVLERSRALMARRSSGLLRRGIRTIRTDLATARNLLVTRDPN